MAISLTFRVDEYANVWKAKKWRHKLVGGIYWTRHDKDSKVTPSANVMRIFLFAVAVELLQRGTVAFRCHSKMRLLFAGAAA